MVPKMAQRGQSFRGVARYLFHDKGASSAERVAWSETLNCWSERPEDAWFEMWDTFKERHGLKAAAGVDRRGRDSTKPVLHYSLAWHPDEMPTQQQMRAAVLESLKALGLDQHQAVMVAHRDEKHPHMHVVVNTVHPHTGKSHGLDYSKEALSRWAEAYEREHGGIRCEQRARNNADRKAVKKLRAEEKVKADFAQARGQEAPPPAPYRPIKDRSPTRRVWLDRREIIDRMRAMHADLRSDHALERGVTAARHRQERSVLEHASRSAIDNAREHVRGQFKPQWRDLYREQKREARHVKRVATHPFERAAFVFGQADRLAGPGKRLSLRERLGLILIPGRLERLVDSMHERERQDLARTQRTETKGLTERIWTVHRERMHGLAARQGQEIAAERSHHAAEKQEVTFERAKGELTAEQPAPSREAADAFKAAHDVPQPPEPQKEKRSERIIREMREARERKGKDDWGREM